MFNIGDMGLFCFVSSFFREDVKLFAATAVNAFVYYVSNPQDYENEKYVKIFCRPHDSCRAPDGHKG